MHYDELAIEIRTAGRGDPVVEVRSSTYGRGSAPYKSPLQPEALDHLLRSLEDRVRHTASPSSPGGPPAQPHTETEPPDLVTIGEAFYRSVFTGATTRTFDRTFGRIEDRRTEEGTPAGLRIRFQFDPEDPHLAPNGAIPWELLRSPETRDFLAQDRRTPVVRCPDVPRPLRPLAVDPPLRVLLIESSPVGLGGLDLQGERRRIGQALAASPGQVEILELEYADLEELRETLLRETIHVVHFMGHGDVTEDGEGVLYFERFTGRARDVPAETFAAHLKGIDTLKLVVLNACASGTLPRHGGRDPFTATAASVTMAGIPAVVAMQLPVTDPAAIAFSQTLYRRLAAHDPIEAAVTEGRLALVGKEETANEWMTPVLYLRGESGALFTGPPAAQKPPSPEPGTPPGPEPEEPRPLRLGIRSLVGLGEGLEAAADRTLSLVEHFDGRAINDPALWAETIVPAVRDFIAPVRTAEGRVILDLAAHQSIAFLCGALLEAKSGVDLSVVQRGHGGTAFWLTSLPGEVVEGQLWREPAERFRDLESSDLAVAVSVTHQVDDDVDAYLDRSSSPVRRVLDATVHPEPSSTSVRDGAHALRLAQTLARRIRSRPLEERPGTVHLFAAAPNALLVFLGQLAPILGKIQIYEYDLEDGREGAYTPGLRWPPEG